MERLRPCLFIYLLGILLSLSISSTTNSDHTNTEIFEWKGGDGVKRSRVRRHNLQLPDALSLPEKVYSMFILWRLLNDVSNDTNAIGTSTMIPDKLESMSSDGPKNTEIVFKAKDKPSSAPTQEQSTHYTGITDPNDSRAMASFPTDPSSPDSQKTTQSGDSQLDNQSTQQLQTTIQTIPEPSQVTEQYILDSTTLPIKNYSKAAEEPSSTIIHEQIDHFTGITNTKDPTAMTSFPTHSPDSQTTTQSGDSLLDNQSTQQLQTIIQTIPELSQVTEQHILDSTTLTIKNYSKAAEEPSTMIIHEQIDHFTGITYTKDPTAMTSFPTHSPDSQTTTQSGDSLLDNQSTQQLQTTIQTIPEPSQVTEQYILDSTTLPIKNYSKAAEEPSSTIIHEQIDHFTGSTNTKDHTAMPSFPTHSPDSQTTTQSGDAQIVNQSTQRLQTTIQTIPEPSQVTEQHILDSTTLTIKISSKAAEEPSTMIIHEQIDHFTGITYTKDPTAMTSFPTHSPDSQTTTQSGDAQIVNQSTQRLQTTIQTIPEPSQVTEQHIPDSTTLTIKISSKAAEEPSTMIIHEQIDHFTGITYTKDPTAMTSFPTHSPDSQTTTQSGDSLLDNQSTQQLQTIIQTIPEPSQVTEQYILDSTTLPIKNYSKAAEEPSSTIIHEQIDHFTGITNTKDPTAMTSFPTHSPDSQTTTQSGDAQLVEESTIAKQKITEPSTVTEQHIPHSKTFTIKISSKAVEETSLDIMHEEIEHSTGTNDSRAITSFSTELPPQESQNNTQSGAPRLFTQHLQRSKLNISEPSQVTEQHISDFTTMPIKNYSKAAEEPSTIIHEQIDHFTGITDTKDPTAMTSFPTHSQTTTQSGDSQLVERSSTIAKQKITEPRQVTEQHIPYSETLTIKIFSEAAEKPSSTIIHEQFEHFTGITDTKDPTAVTSFPTHSPDSQTTTQSGDSKLVEESTITKQKITEPSQVTEQHIPDSKTFTIQISSDITHEEISHSTGTTDSTAITSFSTELPPQESQNNTQSGAPRLLTQHLQHSKLNISEPSQVTEQHILDSTTLPIKNYSKAAEEPSSTIIQEQIDHFTGITDTKDSTAMTSFPTHSPDSQTTTQSGDSQLVEESTITKQKITEPSTVMEQHIPHSKTFTIKIPSKTVEETSLDIMHEESTHSTVTNDSTAITSFHIELIPQESQNNTQSGAPQLLNQSTHFQSTNSPTIPKPSQEFLQPTSVMFTPDMTTTYRNEKETPLQTAINSHITNHGILASTRGNDSLQPTSLPQTMKHEHPRRAITGMVKGISKPTLPAKTKNPTLSSSSIKPEILETATYTHSGTWHNGKPNQFVKATDWRVSKPTPPAFTLKEQTKDSTSLLLPETSISHLNGFTSDSERHKPTPAEESRNQNTEQNAINTSNDGLMQHFLTTKTRILTNDLSVSSKTSSISPLLSLTEDHLVDSKRPGGTSVSKDISLHVSTLSAAPFTTYQMNPKTQSQSTTNKFSILGTIISHTSVLLAKDTSTQAPTDKKRLPQTIPASTEKLTVTFTPNPKPSEKHIHTTSVVRREFLTLITQEIPSWISTKQSNLLPIETTEPRSDLTNQEPTADTVAKEKYPNNDNDLLTEVDKSTQSTTGRKPSKTTRTATTKLHMSKTQKVSRNPKKFILPTHKSADTAIKDDTETHRGIFGLLFTFACLLLLIIVILLWVVWRRWQSRRWRHNMWVAGPPLLCGTYHSVLQSSSTHTAIEMRKGNTQKNKQENSDVHERIALKQQQSPSIDTRMSENTTRHTL